jgi:hypothetical protein
MPAASQNNLVKTLDRGSPPVVDSRQQAVIDHIESQIGRVTARIAPGVIGEVRIPYQGGSETFHAYGWDEADTIEVGTEIIVIERIGPRTVKVTSYEGEDQL